MEYIHHRTLLSYPKMMAYIRSITYLQQQEPHFNSGTAVNYYLTAVLVFMSQLPPYRRFHEACNKIRSSFCAGITYF